ncbi:MAG: hypothetical protein JWM11_4207 [Planctomycetaceae bacterium]|nr:hypothetical protein [Planctomycetaceae bacterium]
MPLIRRFTMVRLLLTFLIAIPLIVFVASDRDVGDAKQHFEKYLVKCEMNEMRCVWFLNDRPNVGMKMTLNLRKYSVHTVRDVFDLAQQMTATQKLSHSQVNTLKRLSGEFPQSNKDVDFSRTVCVAVNNSGKIEVYRYDRRKPPPIIQRLYDIGGGYFPHEEDK